MAEGTRDGIERREFLRRGALLGVGVGLLPGAVLAAGEVDSPGAPHIRAKRTLGRTRLEVSDIAFGSSRLGENEDDLVRHAFDSGVNYFDTAEDYTGGAAERAIGKALQGKRDRCILTSKIEASATGRQADFMRALEGSLRRLRTDHVDIYLNHAVNDVARMKNPEWHAFVEDAKQQGKIRFSGMSGHAGRLIECLDYSLDHDLVDVILVAYNFGQDPAFYQRLMRDFDTIAQQPARPGVMRRGGERPVGVMTMKPLRGALLNDRRPYENGRGPFARAAFGWALSNPAVTGVVISMTSRERIDEYL